VTFLDQIMPTWQVMALVFILTALAGARRVSQATSSGTDRTALDEKDSELFVCARVYDDTFQAGRIEKLLADLERLGAEMNGRSDDPRNVYHQLGPKGAAN
jgi:hypothetical protein